MKMCCDCVEPVEGAPFIFINGFGNLKLHLIALLSQRKKNMLASFIANKNTKIFKYRVKYESLNLVEI